MSDQHLYSPQSPYLHVIGATKSEITDFGWSLANNISEGVVVRFLRGRKMTNLAELYDEFGAALQFPYYFGANLNAFDECLTDLAWLPGRVYILVITDAGGLLKDEDADLFEAFIHSLEEAGDEWSTPSQTSESWGHKATPFHVILQSDEADKQALISRLNRAAAQFNELYTKADDPR